MSKISALKDHELDALEAELQDRIASEKMFSLFPEFGPLRRELYPKHMEFIAAGKKYKERCMLAANRVGKSWIGGYELTCHLTGLYPKWWNGRKFDAPIRAWACGDTSNTVRDIIQEIVLGPHGRHGTGMIPKRLIERVTAKRNVADSVADIYVHHVSGGSSVLGLKSFDQGREAFQGTAQDVVWLDEESSLAIYSECLVRTMTTHGMTMCTFTPLLGLSDTVLYFAPEGRVPEIQDANKFVIQATWDNAPHLSHEEKEHLYASIPAYQRDARSKGVPQLGAGAIYPLEESEITCDPFEIPEHYAKVYGLDVGWNMTSAIWGAWNRDTDVIYLYSEYYRGSAEPAIHAAAIRGRGNWIPGVIDPSARGRTSTDGQRLIELYQDLGLLIAPAKNEVEAGIYNVWERMSTGRLKIFNTLRNLLTEFRIYRRDEKGKIVKTKDHGLDATRYMIMSGLDHASTKPKLFDDIDMRADASRNEITGY